MTDEKEYRGMPKELIPAALRKLTAEAEIAEVRLCVEKSNEQNYAMELKRKKFEQAKWEAGDFFNHVYYYDSGIDAKSASVCMDVLNMWSRLEPECAIEIVFTSPGGDVIAGMSLFDHIMALRGKGHRITTVCQGVAASMAGILLQAGDSREMTAESWILIHQVQAGMMGSFGDLEDRMSWLTRTQERILDIFAKRAVGAVGGTFAPTRKVFKKNWERTDWWIDSDEAKRLGIVDIVR